MDHIGKDAKNRLFKRLDECLMWATRRLGQQSHSPDITNIHKLRTLIDLHRYLESEHTFAPGEVDALLCFADPLAVAQSCWEKNSFMSSFPICKILNDIGAYEQFPLTQTEQERRNKPQVQKLREVLEKNLADYTTVLLGKSKQELIAGSEGIATTQAAYSYMKSSYEYQYGEADLLLQLDDPLKYLASRWSLMFDPIGGDDDLIQEIITDLKDPEKLRHAQEFTAIDLGQGEKPSIRGLLHTAAQEVNQRPPQGTQPQHQTDTPNL